MSNLINLNNIIANIKQPDNKQVLQLSEVSDELLQAIKTHKTGMLEVLAKSDGFDFVLQLGDRNFSVNLKNDLIPLMTSGEKIMFPVRVNSSGNITIFNEHLKETINSQKEMTAYQKFDVIIETKETALTKPTLTPIKLQNFVEQNIKNAPIDTNAKQQIMQIAKDIEVSLKSVGSQAEKCVDITKLQSIIKDIINNPQNLTDLKAKLEQAFNGLIGKQLAGEISTKINQLYVIKTPLGETYFSSPVNIPLSEKVTLDITSQAPISEQKIKFIDDIIRNILPQYKSTSNMEILINKDGFKQLFELIQNNSDSTPLINMIMNKLPFQSDNLFTNIFSLYKGIINQDITQWLGGENIKELLSDNINGQKYITELTNMLQGSLKETATWRIVEMPFFDGNNLSSIKIALKKEKQEKKEKQKDNKTTRFVVETEFSKLGKFQFDGFSKAKIRNLDLIIRTNAKISDDFYTNIINLFKKTVYDLDYRGTIKINMNENFININDDNIVTEGIYI